MPFLKKLPLFVILLGFCAVLPLFPALYAASSEGFSQALPFLYMAVLSFLGAGFLSLTLYANAKRKDRAAKQTIEILLAFLVFPAILAIPLYEISGGLSLFNAYFEMLSALTTTGFGSDVSVDIPQVGHLWRGVVGWFGGGLIWVFAANLFALLDSNLIKKGQMGEAPIKSDGHLEKIIVRFVPLYVAVTCVLWVVLIATGLPAFSALMIALATCSTSGILESSAVFPPGFAAQIFICFMLFAAFSHQAFSGKLLWFLRNPELQTAFFILVLFSVFLSLHKIIGHGANDLPYSLQNFFVTIWQSFMVSLSFLSTTGFVPENYNSGMREALILPLMVLCAFGGGVATTAGGIKLFRLYCFFDHTRREMVRMVYPSALGGMGHLQRAERLETTARAWSLLLLFTISLVFGAVLLGWLGFSFEDALILSFAALSNTGPLAEFSSQGSIDLAGAEARIKVVLGILMVMGRVEILGVVVLIGHNSNKK